MTKNILIIVGVVLIIVVAVIVVTRMKGDDASSTSRDSSLSSTRGTTATGTGGSTTDVEDLGDELLGLLNSIESIDLNNAIFSSPAFQELRDIGIPIGRDGDAGRRNPFAPVGVGNSSSELVAPVQRDAETIIIPAINIPATGSAVISNPGA